MNRSFPTCVSVLLQSLRLFLQRPFGKAHGEDGNRKGQDQDDDEHGAAGISSTAAASEPSVSNHQWAV